MNALPPLPVRHCLAKKDSPLHVPSEQEVLEAKSILLDYGMKHGYAAGLCWCFSGVREYQDYSYMAMGEDHPKDPYIWVPRLLKHLGYGIMESSSDYFWPITGPSAILDRVGALDKMVYFIRGGEL